MTSSWAADIDPDAMLSSRDHERIILSIAAESDNPAVASSLTTLLVATQLAHGVEVARRVMAEAMHFEVMNHRRPITQAQAHAAVDKAFAQARIGDMFAVENLLDVVGTHLG